ncbi:ParB/RepB/Spo0J family partition protein [Streptococcus halichoeri]|uniref:ParB/RepB/Spo0J family partition protein n=1 Tax=Streptococcus halichoeri TaxID=254785 RepID=UPI00135C501B|nr:ParB/RepB/Spo0J family partition protein [Streptococcus halichoeri]
MTEQIINIPVEEIVANPHQPRLTFDQAELLELAESIKMNGLIQPILVRKSEVYGYELIAGERRFKATQMAGLTQIPAIVRQLSTTESMQQAIVENLQRSNLSPLEEAKAYQKILDKKQMTHEQLAKFMGKSRPYITNTIRLLQLPALISQSLEAKEISSGHARALLSVDDQKEQLLFFDNIRRYHLSVRQTEQLIREQHQKVKKVKSKDIFIQAIEQEIAQSLGLDTSVSYHPQKQSGAITIHFANEQEMNRIINKLT